MCGVLAHSYNSFHVCLLGSVLCMGHDILRFNAVILKLWVGVHWWALTVFQVAIKAFSKNQNNIGVCVAVDYVFGFYCLFGQGLAPTFVKI